MTLERNPSPESGSTGLLHFHVLLILCLCHAVYEYPGGGKETKMEVRLGTIYLYERPCLSGQPPGVPIVIINPIQAVLA